MSTALSTTREGSQAPYQLDPEQTLRASSALLAHLKKEAKRLEEKSNKKNLLAVNDDDDSDAEQTSSAADPAVWLLLTTKQHMVDKARLKPGKIPVPHSLFASSDLSICLITADPQRAVKNAVADPSFPSELSSRITRIIGFSKLKARYKTFESRRQLINEHDVFLADDRIIARLVETLGKTFYKSQSKRPIPIRISATPKDESGKFIKPLKRDLGVPKKQRDRDDLSIAVTSPSIVAAEIQRTLNCIPVSIRPGATAAVRVGKTSFTSQQLSENVSAAVTGLTDRFVVKGWRNVKAIHIKGPNSAAMPIWMADELWTDKEGDVLDGENGDRADTNGNKDELDQQIEGSSPSDPSTAKRKPNHKPTGDDKAAKKKRRLGGGGGDGGGEDAEKQEKEREKARKEKLKEMKNRASARFEI